MWGACTFLLWRRARKWAIELVVAKWWWLKIGRGAAGGGFIGWPAKIRELSAPALMGTNTAVRFRRQDGDSRAAERRNSDRWDGEYGTEEYGRSGATEHSSARTTSGCGTCPISDQMNSAAHYVV